MKFLIIFLLFYSSTPELKNNKIKMPLEIIVYNMIAATKSGYIQRKTDCVLKYSKQYNLDVIIFTKLGIAESSFQHNKTNPDSGAVGIYGIMPKYWKHLCYYVLNGKYKNYLHKNKGTNYMKVMHFIAANTEMGAIILSTYLKKYNGDYRLALIQYGGWRAKKFKHRLKERDKYLEKILGE